MDSSTPIQMQAALNGLRVFKKRESMRECEVWGVVTGTMEGIREVGMGIDLIKTYSI